MSDGEAPTWDVGRGEFAEALTRHEQWMAVEIGEDNVKRPKAPWAADSDRKYKWGSEDVANWTTFEQAHDWFEKVPTCPAIAFILQSPDDPWTAEADPFLFIDGDDVRLPDGRVHPAFAALIDGLGATFCEASVSGSGVHALYEGALPAGYETGFAFDLPDHAEFPEAHVEVYHGKRVCICTGQRVQSMPDEVRPVDATALEGLCELVAGESTDGYDVEAEREVEPMAVKAAHSTDATREFDVVLDALAGLTIDDVRIDSEVTGERSDGWLDLDPSFAASDSGKRIGVAPNRRRVVYRDGNHGGDVLALVAWEERIADPGERLNGKAFWDAVRAARARGAPIPAYSPTVQSDLLSDDEGASDGEAEDPPDEPPDEDDGAAQRGPSWDSIRVFFDDEDVEYRDATRDLVEKLSADHAWMAHADNDGMLYWYNPEEGIYEEHGDAVIGEILERNLPRHHTRRLYSEACHRIRQRNWVPREAVGGSLGRPLVAVENGVVNLETGAVSDHSPERRFIKKVAAPYDPDAECPEFDAFLEDVVDSAESKRLVYQLLGHAIHPGYVEDGFCVFYGDGQNGKSTLLEVMRRWLGPENVSARGVQDFENDGFATGTLYGKMANFGGDLPNEALTDSGMLKKLSAGDSITYNAKNQSQFTFQSEATLVFAANDPPAIEDDSKAIYRRLLMVNFPNEFTPKGQPGPDQEPQQEIYDRVLTDEERAGILNRAIEEARSLRTDGFAFSMSVEQRRHQYKKASDPVYGFVSDALQYVEGGDKKNDWLATDEVYAAYMEWCRENDAPVKDKNVMVRELKKVIGGKLEKAHPRRNGRQVAGYYPLEYTSRGLSLAGKNQPGDSNQSGLDV